ncbi:unnamed protein product [Closterium sp. Naga37s-1]|nr:unnamed protein product [Closterium sp. Naga37s-1]
MEATRLDAFLAVLLLAVALPFSSFPQRSWAAKPPDPAAVAAPVEEAAAAARLNYSEALEKCIFFFQLQRSGRLPRSQLPTWRGDSGLTDGKAEGVDLTRGYYDSGDNVKFGFPLAFTVTALAWSVVEYGAQLTALGQIKAARDAVRWGAHFFVHAHPKPNVLYAQVGDGQSDHSCWQRPEDMTTPRTAYRLDPQHPGTEPAAEAAAALAASSMVFGKTDANYSKSLLTHARQVRCSPMRARCAAHPCAPGALLTHARQVRCSPMRARCAAHPCAPGALLTHACQVRCSPMPASPDSPASPTLPSPPPANPPTRGNPQLFNFARKYPKKYTDSIPSASAFYNSYSGFNVRRPPPSCTLLCPTITLVLPVPAHMHALRHAADVSCSVHADVSFSVYADMSSYMFCATQDELLWAAVWLYRATGERRYLDYIVTNEKQLGGTQSSVQNFSWDNKYAGAQVLLAKEYLRRQDPALELYLKRAKDFVCGTVVRGMRSPDHQVRAVASDHQVRAVASDHQVRAVASDHQVRAVASDHQVRAVASDHQVRAVASDHQVRAVASDHQVRAVASDHQVRAVASDHQVRAVASDHQVRAVASDHQVRAVASDHQVRAVASDHQVRAVASDHQVRAVASDHQVRAVASDHQYVTAISMVLSTFADILDAAPASAGNATAIMCDSTPITPTAMRRFVKRQVRAVPHAALPYVWLEYLHLTASSLAALNLFVSNGDSNCSSCATVDYILGVNPKKLSYMVGFSSSYPQRVHHRGASLPSIWVNNTRMGCNDGWPAFQSKAPNVNVLTGAVIGGPDSSDAFRDERDNYQQVEPSTSINAPFVGVLARVAGGPPKASPPPASPKAPPPPPKAPPPPAGKRNAISSALLDALRLPPDARAQVVQKGARARWWCTGMGKKGKGKPGKGKEKTERKTAKAEAKKQRREEKKVDEEDDVDAILAKIAAEEAKKKEVHVEEGVPPPSPRCNATHSIHCLSFAPLLSRFLSLDPLAPGCFPVPHSFCGPSHLSRPPNHSPAWQMVVNPLKDTELIIFGGEFYNGDKVCLGVTPGGWATGAHHY